MIVPLHVHGCGTSCCRQGQMCSLQVTAVSISSPAMPNSRRAIPEQRQQTTRCSACVVTRGRALRVTSECLPMRLPVSDEVGGASVSSVVPVCCGEAVVAVVVVLVDHVWDSSWRGWTDVKRVRIFSVTAPSLESLQMTSVVVFPGLLTPNVHLGWMRKCPAEWKTCSHFKPTTSVRDSHLTREL